MKYRIVEPRMFMVSRAMESWPRAVILTVRRATFIWGVTDEMVPWAMVPARWVSQDCFRFLPAGIEESCVMLAGGCSRSFAWLLQSYHS